MRDTYQTWFYLPAGVTAAILLGMGLSPLRERTPSGNFIFAFVILIIVVAELGGRAAALSTAACSALSLDFFLTRPYMRLSIESKHDMFAFAGLAICGLVAAAIGARHGERLAALAAARSDLELLQATVEGATESGPPAARLEMMLRVAKEALPLGGAVVRDMAGTVVAATSPAAAARPEPGTIVDVDGLGAPGSCAKDPSDADQAFPGEGARLALRSSVRQVGWLDLWGGAGNAEPPARRTLANAARVIALVLERDLRGQ